jgi:long-subunit fatty acid transport protein
MRKTRFMTGIVFVLLLIHTPVPSEAGTFMFGVKAWYTAWDSSVLDWFEKNLIADFAATGRTISTDKDDGSGYLAGPLISYQSDNGKWSASFAPMVFSSFSQNWEGSVAGMDMDADVDLERTDIDLAVSYSFNKHAWVFWGYKYQSMDIDFTLSYNTMMGSITNEYKLESEVHIPTVGTGFVYPVSNKVALSTQLGLLYSIPTLEMTDSDGTNYDIWTKGTVGFNGELTVNYQPTGDLIFQLGYRYQYFRLDAKEPDSEKTESDDITHGPSISAVWVF